MTSQPPVQISPSAIDRQTLLGTLATYLNANQDSQQLTLLALIDLSQFAQINQRFGYLAGDQVLAELQQRLASVPKHPLGCRRIDGDKFGLIITPLLNIQLAPLVAKKIIDQITTPFYIGTQTLRLEAHIGFAASDDCGHADESGEIRAEKLLQNAEAAAKQARQPYFVGEASASHTARHKIALKQKVSETLSENGFELFYQPQIRLADGQPRGAEGLIRWNQRAHG